MAKVLLLNMSYEPLNICSWKRAIILLMKGKAEQLEQNGFMINNEIPAPSVIRLLNYIAVPYSVVPLSRSNVLHRDNYTCQYCGKKSTVLTVDHIIPKSRGGEHKWDNVVAACTRCNCNKSNKTLSEARMTLINKPTTPVNRIHFELTKQFSLYSEWKKYLN